jgi:hypothetical protein
MKVDFIKLTTENHVGIWRSDDQTMKLQALARAMVDPLLPFIGKQQAPNGDCEPTTRQQAPNGTHYCHSLEGNELQDQKRS